MLVPPVVEHPRRNPLPAGDLLQWLWEGAGHPDNVHPASRPLAIAVAPTSSLGNRVQPGQIPHHRRKVDVHPGFDQLCADAKYLRWLRSGLQINKTHRMTGTASMVDLGRTKTSPPEIR